MTTAQVLVNYGFGYGLVSTGLSVLVYLGVAVGGLSVIPTSSTPMLAACLIHFVPYYLTDAVYRRNSVPALEVTQWRVGFARWSTAILVGFSGLHVLALAVATREGAVSAQVMALNLFIVSMFLTTGWSMVWSYGLGDAYLPSWIRRWSSFPFGYTAGSQKPRKGRKKRSR